MRRCRRRLKTSQLEDIQSAVNTVYCFVEVLGPLFFDYVQTTAQVVLHLHECRSSMQVCIEVRIINVLITKTGVCIIQVHIINTGLYISAPH